MAEEGEPASNVLSITAPELLKAITAATGDQGAAYRGLRATCTQLRALLPAAFSQPLVITLSGNGAAAAAGQHHDAAAAVETAESTGTAGATAAAAEQSRAAADPAATPPAQKTHSSQCGWPLMQLWQQYQQQGKADHMLLPEVHLMLGPNLPWAASSSSSSNLPELLLPHCSLLQQQEFLQQVRALTVTCTHWAPTADESSRQQQQQLPQGELKCGDAGAAIKGCAASSLAATLVSSRATLSSFTLGPQGAAPASAFWVQYNQLLHTSSSSSSSRSRATWHSPGPCAVACPLLPDMIGAAVLGRHWLPHLLQLPKLKHLALTLFWSSDEQQQAQQLAALRADLAAAAAKRDGTTTKSSSGSAAPLEVLQLLVPALFPGDLQWWQKSAEAPTADVPSNADCPEALQQLLQALLLELPQLQRLELCVVGGVPGPWERFRQVVGSLGKQNSSLRSFSVSWLMGNPSRGNLSVVGRTWDCGSIIVNGVPALLDMQQQQQQPGKLRQLALSYTSDPARFPPLDSSFLSHVTHLQLAVPQTLLPHLTSLLPSGKAAIEGGSSSRLWRDLHTLELCLDHGALDDFSHRLREWPTPAHHEQQGALQLLLRASRSLAVLRLQGSTRAGVTLLGLLAPLATASAGTLQELQLLHAVPELHTSGTIPFLHEFGQLRRLTLARPALGMAPLMLHTLPPSLQQLHLEGFTVCCSLGASHPGMRRLWLIMQETCVVKARTSLKEQLAAEGLPASEAAAAAAAAAAGGHVAAVMRPEFEEARAAVLPRLVDVMPHLQRLHLLNCSASGRNISLPLLLQWAGPCLQELVLANVHLKDDRFETADAPLDLAPLLRLRRFDWVECRLPMVTGGPVIGLSQLLTFLQDKAPQLQQLKVAAGETQPLLDWHVPLLLGMQQLRRLEVFVGPDVFAELAMRCNQRQQQASATTAADAGATVPSQQQRQQQLSAVLAAMQSLQLHVLQAARFARQVERLADQHVHTTALDVSGPFGIRSVSEPDEDSRNIRGILDWASGCATGLLDNGYFTNLVGMSAAAAGELQQGLEAGRCGAAVLHREWARAAVGEYVYPPVKDKRW